MSLTSIELLLDYLAQQVLDQQLLTLANEHTARATQLLDTNINSPETLHDVFAQESAAANVVRYDDSGEISPVINIGDESVVEQDSVSLSNNTESDALKQAREHVKPDNFDNFETDEDVHDVFLEEVTEVITDLEDFLPIWAQDSQDLTPFIEVRRGFHTLKGSAVWLVFLVSVR